MSVGIQICKACFSHQVGVLHIVSSTFWGVEWPLQAGNTRCIFAITFQMITLISCGKPAQKAAREMGEEVETETTFYEQLVNSPSLWCRISWHYCLVYPFISLCWAYLFLETKQKVTDFLNSYSPLFVFNMVQARSHAYQS
jgi:hypothetical protein